MDRTPTAQSERQRAIELAYRALGRRERTVAELRAVLERKRVEPALIDAAVAALIEAGYLDDERYARRFAEDRRSLARWGGERIARELRRRGVAPQLVDAAVAGQGRDEELRAALALLQERLEGVPGDDRARQRAWHLLVRRGYEPELAYEAIRAHARRAASHQAA